MSDVRVFQLQQNSLNYKKSDTLVGPIQYSNFKSLNTVYFDYLNLRFSFQLDNDTFKNGNTLVEQMKRSGFEDVSSIDLNNFDLLFLYNELEKNVIEMSSKPSFSINEEFAQGWNTKDVGIDESSHLLSLMKHDDYISGYYSESELFFEDLWNMHRQAALVVLFKISNDYFGDSKIQEGVLRILSNLEYEEVYPLGQSLVNSILVTDDTVLQDLVISCYEQWDNADAVKYLTRLDIHDPVVRRHCDSVIKYLEKHDVLCS